MMVFVNTVTANCFTIVDLSTYEKIYDLGLRLYAMKRCGTSHTGKLHQYPDRVIWTRLPGNRKTQYLHRLVAEWNGISPEGKDVDHEDGVTHNNTISNLVPKSHRDNLKNTKHHRSGKWQSK